MRFEKRHDFFETLFLMEFQQRLNRRHDFVKSLSYFELNFLSILNLKQTLKHETLVVQY